MCSKISQLQEGQKAIAQGLKTGSIFAVKRENGRLYSKTAFWADANGDHSPTGLALWHDVTERPEPYIDGYVVLGVIA